MNPKQLLIEFNANYADEFDVEGFIVMSETQWEAHKAYAKKHFEENGHTECYFGTNESCDYSDYDDYMRAFNVTALSEQGYAVLKELFNEHREGYEWEYNGKKHVVPSSDVIRCGMLAMLKPEDDEDE